MEDNIETTREILKTLNNTHTRDDIMRLLEPIILNERYHNDLEIESVIPAINKCSTIFGERHLRNVLKSYKNPDVEETQTITKKLLNNPELFDKISEYLDISGRESDFVWFLNPTTSELQSLYDIIYFSIPRPILMSEELTKFLNSRPELLNINAIYKIYISSGITVFTPLVSVIIPYILVKLLNLPIDFSSYIDIMNNTITQASKIVNVLSSEIGNRTKYFTYFTVGMWIFFYIQSMYITLNTSYNTYKILGLLREKVNKISELYETAKEISKIFPIKYTDSHIIDTSTIGNTLLTYKTLLDRPEFSRVLLEYIGCVDYYIGLARLVRDNGYSFSKFTKRNVIEISDLYHPCLGDNTCKNSVILNNNMLITGPNKAGKSTFMKSLGLAIILGQTLGVSNCKKIKFCKYDTIITYMRIHDKVGISSLFETEINYACECVDMANSGKRVLIIMDEIFTSTNYIEGFSAAYAILEKLVRQPNTKTIITTHFTELSDLEKETDGMIKNYNFTIERSENGDIRYTYKLNEGISKEYIAIELLKNKYFGNDILNKALEVKKKISGV